MADMMIEISELLRPDTVVFPGDPTFEIERMSHAVPDDPGSWSMSRLRMGTHCGTHVDAPAHFVPDGMTVDRIPPSLLCGEALVVDASDAGPAIGADFLSSLELTEVSRLLLRTVKAGEVTSREPLDYAYLTASAADWLVERTKVRLIGIDTLSVEGPEAEAFPVHHRLLEASPPVIIIEGLDLRSASPGTWELLCLPLRIEGGDAAPARAILRSLR